MRNLVLLTFLFVFVAQARAQETLTTFILIRHAEKEAGQNMSNSKDPNLSDDGMKRAERLAALLSKATIDAIYSTPFIRTKKTVEPLARSKSISILEYEPSKPEVIDKIWSDHQGKTIVLCGHSNTIPKIANQLTKTRSHPDFDDSDYGNILVITVSSSGKSSSLTWLRY
jgi:broad specificity phosphatase PhoE